VARLERGPDEAERAVKWWVVCELVVTRLWSSGGVRGSGVLDLVVAAIADRG
jgi:hypothetical protein